MFMHLLHARSYAAIFTDLHHCQGCAGFPALKIPSDVLISLSLSLHMLLQQQVSKKTFKVLSSTSLKPFAIKRMHLSQQTR